MQRTSDSEHPRSEEESARPEQRAPSFPGHRDILNRTSNSPLTFSRVRPGFEPRVTALPMPAQRHVTSDDRRDINRHNHSYRHAQLPLTPGEHARLPTHPVSNMPGADSVRAAAPIALRIDVERQPQIARSQVVNLRPPEHSHAYVYHRNHAPAVAGPSTIPRRRASVPEDDEAGPSRPLRRYVGTEQVPGEGTFHVYDDGYRIPAEVQGERVNPAWGLTKANRPRKRLALACIACRNKKIKCDPIADGCLQCERARIPCKRL